MRAPLCSSPEARGGDSLRSVEVPRRISVEGGAYLRLTWAGGAETVLTAAGLRLSCPCAVCAGPGGAPALGTDPAAWRIAGAELVGEYALRLVFEPDGHETGIFSFDLLAALGGRETGT